jgi:hypothetical protein
MTDHAHPADRSQPTHPPSELLDLLWELSENRISEEGVVKLGEMLFASAAHRDAYVQFMQMVAELEWGQLGSTSMDMALKELILSGDEQRPVRSRSEVRPSSLSEKLASQLLPTTTESLPLGDDRKASHNIFAMTEFSALFRPPMVFLTLLSAMLLSVLATYPLLHGNHSAHESREGGYSLIADRRFSKPQPIATPAAYLTSANGVDWGHSGPGLRTLDAVQTGEEILIYEGIAEFRLSSGVSVNIEGPAALVIASPTSLLMQHGRFTVRVPWAVTDFMAMASTCRIGTFGAEFGVHVAGSEVAVHVFSGEVFASSSLFGDATSDMYADGESGELDGRLDFNIAREEKELAGGSRFVKAVIGSGRALTLENDGGEMKVLHWLTADENEFAAKLSMAGSLPVPKDYIDHILRARPIAYWRFEDHEKRLMRNEIEGGLDLHAIGEVKLVGESRNHAVELGQSGLDGLLISHAPLDIPAGSDYSVEVWVKPSHVQRGSIISLVAEPYQSQVTRHAFCLKLQGPLKFSFDNYGLFPGRVRFLHRDPPGDRMRIGTSCYSAECYQSRRWQHLVATKRGSKMRLYLDGKAVAAARDASFLTSSYLIVGQSGQLAEPGHCQFVGQLDELAIYDQALSDDEVVRHYRAIRLTPDRKSEHLEKEI